MLNLAVLTGVFSLLFVSGFCGVTVGMFWIFDNDRRTCKTELAAMRVKLAQVQQDSEARQRVADADMAAMKQRLQTLAELMTTLHPANDGPERSIKITNMLNTGDSTVGEQVGGNKELSRV